MTEEVKEEFEGECMQCGTGHIPPTGFCSKKCAEEFQEESDKEET